MGFPEKKKVLEDAIKLVSKDKQACTSGDPNFTKLYVLSSELEEELNQLRNGVESSGPSSMVSQESLHRARELDERKQRGELRRRK